MKLSGYRFLLPTVLFVSVFVSFVLVTSSVAYATPIFSQNTTGNFTCAAGSQCNATYSTTGVVYIFGMNITDVNLNVSFGNGTLGNVTFRLGRPNSTFENFTFSLPATTPAITNRTGGNETVFNITLTQDRLGGAGQYNYTWIAVNGTGVQNTSAVIPFFVNKGAQTLTVLLNGAAANTEYDKGGTAINITVSTNATDRGIYSFLQLFSNFTGSNVTLAGNTTNNFNAIYNTTATAGMTLGNYTVFAMVTGASQNFTSTDTNSTALSIILRDISKPTITSPTVTAESEVGGTISISMSVSDADSTTNTITITKPDSTTSVISNYVSGTTSSFTSTGSTGSYSVEFKSVDASGNTATTTKTFTIVNSGSGSSSGGGGGGGSSSSTSGEETRTVNVGEGGATVTMNKVTGHGVVDIEIQVENPANSVQITVEKLAGQPASITQEVSGSVYRYLEISKTGTTDMNIKSGKIKFQVEASWVTENNIDVNTITLNRYSGGAWQELATTLVSSDGATYTFEAETPGFSTFAISGEQAAAGTTPTQPTTGEQPSTTPTETTETTTPGTTTEITGLTGDNMMWIIVGIVAVGAVGGAVYAAKKRRHKK